MSGIPMRWHVAPGPVLGRRSSRLERRSLVLVRASGRGSLHRMRVPDTSAMSEIRNRLHSDAHRRILPLRRPGDGEIRRWTLDRDGSRGSRVKNAHLTQGARLMQGARQQAPAPAPRVAAAPMVTRWSTPDMQRLAWISGAGVDHRMAGATQAMHTTPIPARTGPVDG
jgi:hypothetical protein